LGKDWPSHRVASKIGGADLFGFGKRKCKECGGALAAMEALSDRADDLMKSSALGSAEPIADMCVACRVKLTKGAQSLAMNLHVMEARRIETEEKAEEAPPPPNMPSPQERKIAQIAQAASDDPKPAYEPGGGYKTEEEKQALFNAPRFEQIGNFPQLLLWIVGTKVGRNVAVAVFIFAAMIINSFPSDDDVYAPEEAVATEVPPPVAEPPLEEVVPPPTAQPQVPIPTGFARPANNPGSWATTNDYPSRALNQGREGTTAFLLVVNPQGAVTDCVITQSSGHTDLDDATCGSIRRRARFERAPVGTPVRGYRNRVTWRIPE
jgi:TonB family protein